ncbi:MAG: right-handed parallel beta-helix repeat-containing protein [Deltaproteobacteria bacterium]
MRNLIILRKNSRIEKKAFFVFTFLLLVVSMVAQSFTDFESFSSGSVDYQGSGGTTTYNSVPAGYVYTVPSPYGSLWTVSDEWGFVKTPPSFDQSVTTDGSNKVWRISNAVTSGGFANQPNSPSCALPAGETTSALYNDRGLNHTTPLSPPNPRAIAASRYFHGGFKFKSATGAAQTNLFMTINAAPRQSNVRMSYVGIRDVGTGFNLEFYETMAGGAFPAAPTIIATNLCYTAWYQLDFYIEFVDGLSGGNGNDIMKIYLNGMLIHTGTTWETYYASPSWTATPYPIAVDAIMFRLGGTAVAGNSGNGFYIDNVSCDNAAVPASSLVQVYNGPILVSGHSRITDAIKACTTLNGFTINVAPGTYNEQVIVDKELTIIGTGGQPTIDFTGTPTGKLALFDITANNVTIENIDFNVDMSKLRSAIIASSVGLENIIIKNSNFDPYNTPTGSYGDRNAVSINYGGPTNYRIAAGGVNNITFQDNTVTGNVSSFFRAGVAVDEAGGSFTGNTSMTGSHDILVRFAGNGPVTISNNNLNGGGIELSDQNAGAGLITVATNIFNAGFNDPNIGLLRIKNNYNNIAHAVSGNTFNNYQWAVSLENMRSVTLDQNTFNSSVANAHGVVVNTKSLSTNSNTIVQVPVDAVMTNNNFNGTGYGISFLNHDSDNDSYGTFTIGTSGNENSFASSLTTFIDLDNQTGSSIGSAFPNYDAIIGTGTGAGTTKACWDQNIDIRSNRFDVGSGLQLPSAMNFTQRTALEAKLIHKPDFACLGSLQFFLPVHNLTQNTYFATIQPAINAANPEDVIELSEGTYNETVTITKKLTLQGIDIDKSKQVIDGTGLGITSGIVIANGVQGVTIKNLTVQNFTGTNGNTNAGIYAIGGNNDLTVTNVALMNNSSASGFYANGPINNVSITNSMASNNGSGARGIVIWNGLKSNITISGNMLANNNCCGIELQDGDASAVNISGNTIDIQGGDNAIGLIGLNNSIGSNLINNNIITGGGRFGIEIKNPAGGVTVSGNQVTMTTQNGDLRDRAGIAILRRGVLGSNVDVPNNVTITGNTVDGYQQSGAEEGFGIVVEGINHTVTGNTVQNCEVGILQQQNPTDYPSDANTGSGGSPVLSPNLFGRGNSPITCGNTISGNTFSGNGTDTRDIGVGYGVVTNTNTSEYFCSIQAAINDAQTLDGHTLQVSSATFGESVTVNKRLTISGAGNTTVVQGGAGTAFTYTAAGSGASSANRAYLKNLKISGSTKGLYANELVNYLTLDGVSIDGNSSYGIHLNNTSGVMNDWVLTNCTFNANSDGFRMGMAANVNGLSITGTNFSNQVNSAIYIPQQASPAGGCTNVTISNNTFTSNGANANNQAAMYIEKLTNGLISGNTMTNNGLNTNPRGIIINLKYGSYNNITISDNIFSETRGATQTNGYGINVQGRNDATSYNSNPGSLTSLTVSGNEITGFYRGIEVDNAVDWNTTQIENNLINSCNYGILGVIYGTGNSANTGTKMAVHNNSITGLTGTPPYAIVNSNPNSGKIDGTCNWFGTTDAASIAAMISGDVKYGPWLVSGGDGPGVGFQPAATCTGCNTGVLVYIVETNTYYCTFAEAVSAAGPNQTIELQIGTVTLTSPLTIGSGQTYLIKSGTTLINTGQTITNNGTMTLEPGGNFTNTGIYQGNGEFNGNFINNGTVRPGN